MLFRRIREHTGTFRAENVELYHGWVGELAAEITDGWARSHTSLSPAEAEALRLRLVESMQTLLDQDAVQFDGYAIEVLETYESVALDDGTVLGGRMDRRMATPDDNEAVIIDYKKRTIPKARELRVGEVEAGRVTRPQLALYAEILARLGRGVSGLYFYSVENEEYLSVFARSGGGILTAEELRAARAAAMEALERAIAGIKAGDFRFPDPWMGCESCDFPGICRSRFRTG
jgi:RecB family exonuclease